MVGTNKAFKIPSLIENTVACPHKQDKTKSNIRYLSKIFVNIILFSRITIIISYLKFKKKIYCNIRKDLIMLLKFINKEKQLFKDGRSTES